MELALLNLKQAYARLGWPPPPILVGHTRKRILVTQHHSMYGKLSYGVDCIFCSKYVVYNSLNTSLLNVCTKASCHHVLIVYFRPNNLFYNVYVSMAQTVHSCNIIYRQIIRPNLLILVGHPYNPFSEPIRSQGDDNNNDVTPKM